MTTSLDSFSGTSEQLLEQAASHGADHTSIITVAQSRLNASGDESWALPIAFSLWQLKRPLEAMSALDLAQSVSCADANFHMLRGVVARSLPDNSGNQIAIDAYRQAISIDPNRADAFYCLANLISDADDIVSAESYYHRSLLLNPFQPLAWHNLGRMLCFDDRHSEALPYLQRSILLDPLFADGWCNLGLAWLGLHEFDRSLGCFYQAISLDDSHAPTHINIGNALISKLQPDEALHYLEKGASLESSSSNSLWNLSLCYLLLGRYIEGWKYYEARYNTDMFMNAHVPTCGSKITTLEQLQLCKESSVVVWSEQGMGDSIQFFRYLYLIDSLGIKFEFHSRPQLIDLFQSWSPFSTLIVPERSTDSSKDTRPHVSLMSLPMVFKTDIHTIPAVVPYLRKTQPTPSHLVVTPPPGGISIGLVWASNPDNKAMYKAKSFPLALLMPTLSTLLDLDLIHLHSLQFGDDSAQLHPWIPHDGITVWNDRLSSFSETAFIIDQLDLVICVDTAVAHLAGALNKPTWLLLPENADFRWLRDINTSPWYSSIRLFRQPSHGDWQGVISQVHEALCQLTLLDLHSLSNREVRSA